MQKIVTIFFILAAMTGGIIMFVAPAYGQQVVVVDGSVKLCNKIGSGPNSIMICF